MKVRNTGLYSSGVKGGGALMCGRLDFTAVPAYMRTLPQFRSYQLDKGGV